MRSSQGNVTQLLIAWNNGDPSALNHLMPLVEDELRRVARHHMRGEKAAHTLQTTALVNEVYLKLVDQKQANWHNRAHFFAIAAQLMRRILNVEEGKLTFPLTVSPSCLRKNPPSC